MTFDEAEKSIIARMTPAEREAHLSGCEIVDWLMDIASNDGLPASVRCDARSKLRACALRKPSETVQDVIGSRH